MNNQTKCRNSEHHAEVLARQYCKQVRHHLACSASIHKPILEQLNESILSYLDEHPDSDLQGLYTHFGSPENFAADILEGLDGKQIQTQVSRYRWRRILVILILGLALLYCVFYCARLTINWIFQPGYVVIGPAVEDEGPIPTSPPN